MKKGDNTIMPKVKDDFQNSYNILSENINGLNKEISEVKKKTQLHSLRYFRKIINLLYVIVR